MDNVKILIDLEDNGATASVKQLREYLDEMRGSASAVADELRVAQGALKETQDAIKELNNTRAKSREEAQEQVRILAELTKQEAEQKQKVSELSQVFKTQIKDITAADGSYDQLNATLGRMRDTYRQLSETERKGEFGETLLKNIQVIDKELKNIDASMGNYQRNVGNYESALKNIEKTASGVRSGFLGMAQAVNVLGLEGTGLSDVLSKIQLGLLVVQQTAQGIPAIVTAFKAAKAAAIGFSASLKGVRAALISTGIGAVVVMLAAIIANWDKISSMFRDTSATARAKNALDNLNESLKENADIATNASTEALNAYTQALKDAGDNIEAIEAAEKQYQQTLRETALTQAQANKAAADAAVQEIEGIISTTRNKKKLKELEDSLAAARKEQIKANGQLAKAENDITKAAVANTKERVKADRDAAKERQRIREQEIAKQKADAAKEREAAEREAEKKKESLIEINEKIYLNTLTDKERELKVIDDKYNEERRILEEFGQDTTELTEQYQAARLGIINKYLDQESEARLNARFDEIGDVAKEEPMSETNNPVERIEQQIAANERLKESIRSVSEQKLAAIDTELEQENLSFDRYVELSEERARIEEETEQKIRQADQKTAKLQEDLQKARRKQIFDYSMQSLQAVGGLLSSLSDLYDENSEEQKKMQIASAVVNGLANAAMAFNNAMGQLGPIAGPIVGTINAASVIATTAAQIKKIKSNSDDLSSNSPVAATPAVGQLLDSGIFASQLGTDTELDLQAAKNTRVYVLESDISDAQDAVKTRVDESEF